MVSVQSSDSDSSASATLEAQVPPLQDEALGDVKDIIDAARAVSGYAPTSLRIMARKPAILRAFSGLLKTVMRSDGDVPSNLRWLAAHSVSQSAGCRYCQAHTAANGHKAGCPKTRLKRCRLSKQTLDSRKWSRQ